MKTIADLKLGDIAWRVMPSSIIEDVTIDLLSKKLIETSRSDYAMPIDKTIDRIKDKYNNTLCMTYSDAVDLATIICFKQIKDHAKTIHDKMSTIDAIGLRIHELYDLKYTVDNPNEIFTKVSEDD